MTSGADLFVVCKQCGSEVSPYITECPYCGQPPAQARAEAAARERARPRPPRSRRGSRRCCALQARRACAIVRARGPRRARSAAGRRAPVRDDRAGGGQLRGVGRLAHAEPRLYAEHGDHRARCTATGGSCSRSEFAYIDGVYAFVALVAIGDLRLAARAPPRAGGWCSRCSSARAPRGRWWRARCTPTRSSAAATRAALALLAAWAAPDLQSAARAAPTTRATCWARGRSRRCCWRSRSRCSGGELAGGRHRRRARPAGRARPAAARRAGAVSGTL